MGLQGQAAYAVGVPAFSFLVRGVLVYLPQGDVGRQQLYVPFHNPGPGLGLGDDGPSLWGAGVSVYAFTLFDDGGGSGEVATPLFSALSRERSGYFEV